MPLYGKLAQSGQLTDIQSAAAPRTWMDGSTDVVLVSMPTDFGPWTYDAVNQVAVDAPSILTSNLQAVAISEFSDTTTPTPRVLRAVVALLVNELNLLRDRLTAQDNAIAAATTLADLKTRWATLAASAPMPDRTTQQAATAVQNAIQGNA